MTKSANNCYAKVVLDSVGPNGKRIVSVQTRYWRAIHAEIMTHRDRARNAASSRAIPFIRWVPLKQGEGLEVGETGRLHDGVAQKLAPNCTYSFIKNDAFFPEFMGTEQKGMQSGGELVEPNRSNCLESIERMRDFCLKECEYLFEQGLHKSIINRYLEPWSYITVIMTATEWKNFFRLRVHPKAEKHFNKVAAKIKRAIEDSIPQELEAGDWHMPYLRGMEDIDEALNLNVPVKFNERELEKMSGLLPAKLKRISAARCGRLSYLTHDGIRDQSKDLELFETLIHPKLEADRDDDVIHSSPLEHVAEASDKPLRSGPFDGWFQFRKEFPNENVAG